MLTPLNVEREKLDSGKHAFNESELVGLLSSQLGFYGKKEKRMRIIGITIILIRE